MVRAGRAVTCPHRAALATALLVLLAGCTNSSSSANPTKPRRALDTSAPIEAMPHLRGTTEQRLLGFLQARYGDRARLEGAWQDQWEDTEVDAQRPVTREVCAREPVHRDGRARTLLAVCQRLEDAASVEPGRIDLYALQVGEDARVPKDTSGLEQLMALEAPFRIIAQRLQAQYGQWGAPGTVGIVGLGPQRDAFIITHPWARRGATRITRSYVAMHGDYLREVASYRDHLDNDRRQDCDAERSGCEDARYNIDFSTQLGSDEAVDGFWPLIVRGTGQDCAGPFQEYHRLIFDPTLRAYAVPDSLQREGCGTP